MIFVYDVINNFKWEVWQYLFLINANPLLVFIGIP